MLSVIKPTMCIYHGSCADGFGAALAVYTHYGNNLVYHAATYGNELPDVTGHDVLMLDLSLIHI